MGKYWKYPILMTLATFLIALGACTPDTKIVSRKFDNEGNVLYEVLGISPCPINLIRVELNGTKYQDVENNSVVTVPITTQNTSITATAYNNWGKDPTPAEDSFDIPTSGQAKTKIESILLQYASTYTFLDKGDDPNLGVLLTPGSIESFYADFRIVKLDGKDAIIDYVGLEKTLAGGIAHKETLNLLGVPNRYIFRKPEDEIEEVLKDFIAKGYNN